jgi:Mn2+/Fe2+ NRAMP family transporter
MYQAFVRNAGTKLIHSTGKVKTIMHRKREPESFGGRVFITLYFAVCFGLIALFLSLVVIYPILGYLRVPLPTAVTVVFVFFALIMLAGGAIGYRRFRERWVPSEHMHCESCGYDLTGNESGRCPECGTELH